MKTYGMGCSKMASEKRLIDANEVERKLRLAISSWWCDNNSNAPVIARAMQDAMQRVIYAPTVDAVEVVRCKDCKHRGSNLCPMETVELYPWFGTKNDAFCSYGERRE